MAQETAKSFLGIPGLDPGPFIGGTFGAVTTFVVTWANRRFGAGDTEKRRREEWEEKVNKHLEDINRSLLKVELKQEEQEAFIEPIREVMQDAIKKRLREGLT